jgi:methionine biosynthesis protein MetW
VPSDRAADMCSRVLDEVEARIESMLRGIEKPGSTLLDIGCWDGGLTLERGRLAGADTLLGVEVYEQPAEQASHRGIEVARIDLEAQALPWADESVDIVVCNQVLEHLKNIWLPMSEMHRVLRPGGHAILSVPNLASLHNRVLLALGRQPTSIRLLGPHVRGYTLRAFADLIEWSDAYEIELKRGAGFYPLTSPWSAPLSRLWCGASHTIVVQARKTSGRIMLDAYMSDPAVGHQTFYGSDAEAPTAA